MGCTPILEVKNLTKLFAAKKTTLKQLLTRKRRVYTHAVEGVSLTVHESDKLAIIGESGSGKTTLARLMLGLIKPTSGKVNFEGRDIFAVQKKKLRRKTAMIFQDPYSSVNPRMRVYKIVAEPLKFHGGFKDRAEEKEKIARVIESVNLTPVDSIISRHPRSLSGGQLQRVCLARALIHDPKLLILDEPVSMLDGSVKAGVLNLLKALQLEFGLTYVFISHDIAAGHYTCDDMAVMYLGKVVEKGSSDVVVNKSLHPYTVGLIQAVPTMEEKENSGFKVVGVPASPANPPKGCRFHPRCSFALDECRREEPKFIEVEEGHFCACHLVS